jgi:hypothetical protein
MFRRNGRYRILSKDLETDDMQYINIQEVQRGGASHYGRAVTTMVGVVMDGLGNRSYVMRVAFRREFGTASEKLRSVPYSDLPTTIESLLGQRLVPHDAGRIVEV